MFRWIGEIFSFGCAVIVVLFIFIIIVIIVLSLSICTVNPQMPMCS